MPLTRHAPKGIKLDQIQKTVMNITDMFLDILAQGAALEEVREKLVVEFLQELQAIIDKYGSLDILDTKMAEALDRVSEEMLELERNAMRLLQARLDTELRLQKLNIMHPQMLNVQDSKFGDESL